MNLERMERKLAKMTKRMAKTSKRMQRFERDLEELRKRNKPIVYIDEDTALVTSEDADIEFIKRKNEE